MVNSRECANKLIRVFAAYFMIPMVRLIDIVIVFLESLIFFVLGLLILEEWDRPILMLPLTVVYIIIHYSIKRNKRILKYVKADFKKLGFDLISERPATRFERKITMETTVMINNIGIGRYGYIRKFNRVFTARNQEGQLVELVADVSKMWSGENKIQIRDKEIINE